jgi:hypothetical protein
MNRSCATRDRRGALATFVLLTGLITMSLQPVFAQEGAANYSTYCASCHGVDGAGGPASVGLDVKPADFSDCSFALREPDSDWLAVAHGGGPSRGFSEQMPAWGGVLSIAELEAVMAHIRGLCSDQRWPRGELNLPRALFTEKAFPEDEAVLTFDYTDGGSEFETELLYEKRFGPQGQLEISLPLVYLESVGDAGSDTQFGDLAVGWKQNLFHEYSDGRGQIFSVGIEAILPTGDEDKGFGKGTTIIEPYLSYGKLWPGRVFLQLQLLGEFANDSAVDDEAALRAALGKTWSSGASGFGRAWTPMLEALVFKDLHGGADTKVDLVPQLQVTLNRRQHIMVNAGFRIPANHTEGRDTRFVVYLLWDWFDGGLFEGW